MTLGIEALLSTHTNRHHWKILLEANVPLVHTINTVCYNYMVVDDKFFPFPRIGIVRAIN